MLLVGGYGLKLTTILVPVENFKNKMSNLKLQEEPTPPKQFFGVRHIQATLYFFMIWITLTTRVSLSVAIVAMTDSSATPNPNIPVYNWDDKSVVLSSFFWGYILPHFFAGQLTRAYGPKWFLVASMLINSVALMTIPVVANNFGSKGVMGCRLIQGLAQGFVFPSLHNLLGKWAPTPERSRIGTFVLSGNPFGTIVAMLVTGQISGSWAGWPVSFYVFGSFCFVWVAAWIWLGANSPEEHRSISVEERRYIEATLGPKENTSIPTPWRDMLVSIPLWAIFVGNLGFNWGYATLLTEIPTYLNKIMNFDIKTNSLLSAAPYFAFWILSLVVGPIADYLTNIGAMSRGGVRKLFNSIGTCVPAAALVWLGFVPEDQPVLSVVLLVLAVGMNAGCFCGFLVNHIDLSPNHAGVLMGMTNGVAYLISTVAPLVVHGVVYDETDKSLWRIIFIIAACIYVSSAIFYVMFASGEVQYWNQKSDDGKKDHSKVKVDVKIN